MSVRSVGDTSKAAAPSARGLFRSMGKKGKPVVVETDGGYERVGDRPRAEDDFYPTPPEPTRALIAAEYGRLRDFATIWEPAAGDGAMVRELKRAGFDVFPSDLFDRGHGGEVQSFLRYRSAPSRAVVTNPPFNLCNARDGQGRWIWHALDTLKIDYMALLLSWSWPAAGGHARLWAEHPPARVYLMRWKIDFTGQGAPPMLNGWFVWDGQTPNGQTRLLMLDKTDILQGELFNE